MKQYLDLLNRILTEGVHKEDRTGTLVYLVIKCASIWKKASPWSQLKNYI